MLYVYLNSFQIIQHLKQCTTCQCTNYRDTTHHRSHLACLNLLWLWCKLVYTTKILQNFWFTLVFWKKKFCFFFIHCRFLKKCYHSAFWSIVKHWFILCRKSKAKRHLLKTCVHTHTHTCTHIYPHTHTFKDTWPPSQLGL